MNVRPERAAEESAVREVHLAAFGDHGGVVADLADDLRETVQTGDGISLVAEAEGKVVGHAMFTPSLLDAPERLVDVRVLSPVGVLPAWQRRGVGSELIHRGVEMLVARSVPVVFVEGPPEYYSRFGFRPGAESGFRKPSLRIPDSAFQALQLSSYEEWMIGTLVYAEPFWRHDAVGLRPVETPG